MLSFENLDITANLSAGLSQYFGWQNEDVPFGIVLFRGPLLLAIHAYGVVRLAPTTRLGTITLATC